MPESAWFCNFPRCEVAYFNEFEEVVLVTELVCPVYPKDFDAPVCHLLRPHLRRCGSRCE